MKVQNGYKKPKSFIWAALRATSFYLLFEAPPHEAKAAKHTVLAAPVQQAGACRQCARQAPYTALAIHNRPN